MNSQNEVPGIHPNAGQKNEQSFFGLGIAPKILEILERIKFKNPTPIQMKAIPIATQGKDIIGVAQTGTGKTHAFAIPMTQLLAQRKGMGLVLAPTRELALQIDAAFKVLLQPFGMKTACLIGGAPMHSQIESIRKNPRVVIATPGRLMDHINRRIISLKEVVMLVLDEADRMLDMGFAPQVEKILSCIQKERQTMLFSATIGKEIMGMATRHMKLPVSVEIAPSGTTAEKVTQELFIIKKEDKIQVLKKLLEQYLGPVLLFARTRHGAVKITRSIRNMGFSASEIHSDRTLGQRREALDGFKSGKYKVLVATDIASRGIDVTGIELVINYDLPDDAENYVHRIGRTARAGQKGHAISFATPEQSGSIRDIERLIRTSIPIGSNPQIQQQNFFKPQRMRFAPSSRFGRSRRPSWRGRK